MAQNNKVIQMKLDSHFYKRLAEQKFQHQDYKKAAEYFEKVLDMSPHDFESKVKYAESLVKLGLSNKAEQLYYESIAQDEDVADSYYELSQLNIIKMILIRPSYLE